MNPFNLIIFSVIVTLVACAGGAIAGFYAGRRWKARNYTRGLIEHLRKMK